jgi:predicted nucleic acid-binding protein
MILAGTSVWVEHFRQNNIQLQQQLFNTHLCIHPMVIAELACGNLKNRKHILSSLDELV